MGKHLIILFSFFVCLFSANAGIIITSSNEELPYDLSGNIYYLHDEMGAYSFEMIMNGKLDDALLQSESSSFYFSGRAPSQWYKFSVENTTEDYQTLVFGVENNTLENVTFFSSIDSAYYTTGAKHPFGQRQIKDKDFLFYIKLKPKEQGDFCLFISDNRSALHIDLSLKPASLYNKDVESRNSMRWGYYLVSVFLVFILIVLYYSEHDKSYLLFVFFLLSLVLYKSWSEGVLFQYIWPSYPLFNNIMGRVLYIFSGFMFIFYTYIVFRIREEGKNLVLFYKTSLGIFLLLVLVQLFNIAGLNTIALLVVTLLSMVAALIGLRVAYENKSLYKGLYTFIYSVYVLALISNIIHHYGVKGALIGEVQFSLGVIVSFFIVYSLIFVLKYQKAKSELLVMNKELERKVDKRTQELSIQKEELRSQHEELLIQKETLQTQREELRAQKELLEIKNVELEKLSLVASETDNLIYILNPNGDLDWFNSSFGILHDMSHERYRQRENKLKITDMETNNNIKHVFNTCLREKTVVSFESEHNKPGGGRVWYQTTLTPILSKDGEIKHLIAIDTDITRLKNYENELNEQRKEAETQKNIVLKREEDLEEQQVRLMDSIRYAKRIQSAILPKAKQIQRDFYDSFVLFLPKDIVSGDFYWYHRIEDKYFIAAVDCTGHGVPGAFMSIIGNYLLNSIIIHNNVSDPVEILKQLNRKIKIALKTDNRVQTSDGMDVALVVVDKKEGKLEYAGALRPLYLFSNGRFIEVKGDKIPITSSITGTTLSSYTKHTYDFKEDDSLYIFSDGIIDQFGGEQGKKFLTKRFKELLFEISPLTMREQKTIIKKALDDWRGSKYEQVDDVLVIGLRNKEGELG